MVMSSGAETTDRAGAVPQQPPPQSRPGRRRGGRMHRTRRSRAAPVRRGRRPRGRRGWLQPRTGPARSRSWRGTTGRDRRTSSRPDTGWGPVGSARGGRAERRRHTSAGRDGSGRPAPRTAPRAVSRSRRTSDRTVKSGRKPVTTMTSSTSPTCCPSIEDRVSRRRAVCPRWELGEGGDQAAGGRGLGVLTALPALLELVVVAATERIPDRRAVATTPSSTGAARPDDRGRRGRSAPKRPSRRPRHACRRTGQRPAGR